MTFPLATFERTLSPSDSKQNIPFTFRVPAGITQLTIRLTFAPLLVDGIRNLLTLTVFDPSGWRGAGHRQGTHRVAIGAQSASPGFRAGPIQPGEWTVFVDTHLVMPGPPCDIRLEVRASARRPNEKQQTPSVSRPAVPSRSTHTPPRRRGWYRGDLHGHSIHSDAFWDVADLVAWSHAHRLDFATLSDHNTVSGLAELDAASADRDLAGLLTLGGMELTTFWGHALALGVREWIDWRSGDGGRTIEQIATEVQASGGLFVIAHPMQIGDPYCTGCQWHYPSMMPGTAHVVEVWNGDWEGEAHNEAALKLAFEWLNAGHRLALTSGTDNHGPNRDALSYGFDVVYAEDLSEREILRAVQAGHLYLSAGPRVELVGSIGLERAMMGDSLEVAAGMKVQLAAAWEAAAPGAILDLIVDGRSRSTRSVPENGSQNWEVRFGEAKWCLVTLREVNGRMQALTNPIYLDGRD